jgi:molybdate transport system ATP-binding protein
MIHCIMNILVSLKNCSYDAQGGTILSSQTFDIFEGDCLRIAGANGSGKTTLLRVIKGELNPSDGIGPSRTYYFGGEESVSPIHAKKHVRMVSPAMQNLYRQRGWNITGFECVATGFDDTPLLYEVLSKDYDCRVRETLDWLGFSHLADKSMIRMSRGEARKILMARALVSRPAMLLLDEFMHELDPQSRVEIARALEKAHAEGVTIVYTTHIENEALEMTTREIALADTHPKSGAYGDVAGIVRSVKRAEVVAPDVLYELRGATVYREERPVIRNMNLVIRRGEQWAVVGSNGAGKSTLMKTLSGEIRPAIGGFVSRLGVPDGELIEPVISRTGVVSSELQCEYEGETLCEDVVASGFTSRYGEYGDILPEWRERAALFLRAFGLSHCIGRFFNTLSYGEQRKTVLARALVNSPEAVILDEVFAGIDTASREWIRGAIETLCGEGISFVLTVHHFEDIPRTVNRILHLENGIVRYSGPIGDFPAASILKGV